VRLPHVALFALAGYFIWATTFAVPAPVVAEKHHDDVYATSLGGD